MQEGTKRGWRAFGGRWQEKGLAGQAWAPELDPQHPHNTVFVILHHGGGNSSYQLTLWAPETSVFYVWFSYAYTYMYIHFHIPAHTHKYIHIDIYTYREKMSQSVVRFNSPTQLGDFLCYLCCSLWVLFKMIHLVHLHKYLTYRPPVHAVLWYRNEYRAESLRHHKDVKDNPHLISAAEIHWVINRYIHGLSSAFFQKSFVSDNIFQVGWPFIFCEFTNKQEE